MKISEMKILKRPSLKAIAKLFLVLFFIAAGFVAASVVFLSLAQLVDKGFNDKNIALVERFLLKLKEEPSFLWDAYEKWWKIFTAALQY